MSPTDLARKAKISVSYAHALVKGERSPSREVAYRIHDIAGLKLGHLADLSDAEIAVARKLDRVA